MTEEHKKNLVKSLRSSWTEERRKIHAERMRKAWKDNNPMKNLESIAKFSASWTKERKSNMSEFMKQNNPMRDIEVAIKHKVAIQEAMDKLWTTEYRQKQSEKMRENNPMKNPETINKVSEALKGRIISEEHKEIIRKRILLNNPMNNQEYRNKISIALTGKKLSLNHRESLSKSHKGYKFTESQRINHRNSLLGHTVSPETRNKISHGIKKSWQRGDMDTVSIKMAERFANGRGKAGIKYKYGYLVCTVTGINERYDSSYERIRMEYLNDLGLNWTKIHGIRIPYYWNGRMHHYVPDILIESTILEEIKPKKILIKDTKEKMKIKTAVFWSKLNGIIFKVITERDLFHRDDQ